MTDWAAEKRIRARNLFGNEAAIADVTTGASPMVFRYAALHWSWLTLAAI